MVAQDAEIVAVIELVGHGLEVTLDGNLHKRILPVRIVACNLPLRQPQAVAN
jgi:hypothetical protein